MTNLKVESTYQVQLIKDIQSMANSCSSHDERLFAFEGSNTLINEFAKVMEHAGDFEYMFDKVLRNHYKKLSRQEKSKKLFSVISINLSQIIDDELYCLYAKSVNSLNIYARAIYKHDLSLFFNSSKLLYLKLIKQYNPIMKPTVIIEVGQKKIGNTVNTTSMLTKED